MKNFFILLIILCMCGSSFSQTLPPTKRYLDKNRVKAMINTVNDKFWDINSSQMPMYEVPKGQGKQSGFANSIWIGGLDAGNQLHMSANTYKQSGRDFWPGPLDTTNIANFSTTATAVYNRLWKADCNEINSFVTAFNNGSVTANTYTVPPDILAYPARGIMNFQKSMSPFIDGNFNGIYDPLVGGDYPVIKGHQQVLSIYNDRYAQHTETQMPSMGLEIYERSYAYSDPAIHDTMQAINYTTFYHYTIFNRSETNYHDVYISDWNDVDLGYYMNDYIGSDTLNNFAYCYNGTAFDPTALGVNGYGNKLPVSSCAILRTDCSNDGIDNNQNNVIDEPFEQFRMNRVTYYNNNYNTFPSATTNPTNGAQFYTYMKGIWKDASPFSFGGTAYGGTVATHYVYPGDPQNNTGWTETTAGNTPGDRRLLLTSGPFNFPAHSKIEWGFSIVFSQDTTQAVNAITQFASRVQRDVRNIRYYDSTHQVPQCVPQILYTVGIKKNVTPLKCMIYPNPAKDALTVDLNENVFSGEVTVLDLLGKAILYSQISNGYRTTVDLNSVSAGLYLLEIRTGDQKQVFKFVRE